MGYSVMPNGRGGGVILSSFFLLAGVVAMVILLTLRTPETALVIPRGLAVVAPVSLTLLLVHLTLLLLPSSRTAVRSPDV